MPRQKLLTSSFLVVLQIFLLKELREIWHLKGTRGNWAPKALCLADSEILQDIMTTKYDDTSYDCAHPMTKSYHS